MKQKINVSPIGVFTEFRRGNDYKSAIGDKGIFEQSKINERFYVGDHWYGAKCGNERPLVRRNIIKRIGDFKMSTIASSPVAVNFSAEGVPQNGFSKQEKTDIFNAVVSGRKDFGESDVPDDLEISTVMQFLTDYGTCAMERVGFNALAAETLKNAYISGTGFLYTYWDEQCETGLYADDAKRFPISGDIACEILDVGNIVLGDPNNANLQSQPYIIVSQRRDFEEVRREAIRNGVSAEIAQQIVPDGSHYGLAGKHAYSEDEPMDSRRVTVLTKFYKQWDKEGKTYCVMCTRVTENAVVREPWDIGIKLYPIASIVWDNRRNSAYGDSEITYLIPNQIAINRALTAEVWAMMATGMPIMLQNGDVIPENITNEPGQIVKVYGTAEETADALRYIEPPVFAGQMMESVNNLAANTLSDSGATDAALGNVRPDNASAIIQMREAALQPLQLKQNQYYTFIEDVMRIWAQFWLCLYGDRRLKIATSSGNAYVPFHAHRYENLLINAKVDVGASSIWSTSVVVSTLDSLLEAGVITPAQYLERLPNGLIPDKMGLMNDARENPIAEEEKN